jgi:hypothetical protein
MFGIKSIPSASQVPLDSLTSQEMQGGNRDDYQNVTFSHEDVISKTHFL